MRLKLNQRVYNIRAEKINTAVGKDLASKIKLFAKIFIEKAKIKDKNDRKSGSAKEDKNHLKIIDF